MWLIELGWWPGHAHQLLRHKPAAVVLVDLKQL
jgi:hypothetical protein